MIGKLTENGISPGKEYIYHGAVVRTIEKTPDGKWKIKILWGTNKGDIDYVDLKDLCEIKPGRGIEHY